MNAIRWDELSWEDIAALRERGMDMAILPVGATEQHGLHLPLGVDTLSAMAVAEGVSARTGVPVLPSLAYGCSLGHSPHWPGTLSLRPETLSRLVYELAEWLLAAGVTRLLILNGHVTNWAPLRCALENIRHDHPALRVAIRSLWDIDDGIHHDYHRDAKNFHANCAETSLMLALRPELVKPEKYVDEPDRSAHCFFSYRVDQESHTGCVGAPSAATREEGSALLVRMVESLSAQVCAALRERSPLEPHNGPE